MGAYSADLLFQGFGYAAFLLPMGILALALRWFRSKPFDSPLAKLIGYGMLVVSLPALLALWSVPQVRGALPAGGLIGTLASAGLLAWFNSVGAHLVALCVFLTGLLLATPFSFLATHAALRGPMERLSLLAGLRARWSSWREARRQNRLKKLLETNRLKGRQPAPAQTLAAMESRKTAVEDEKDSEADDAKAKREHYEPVLIASQTPAGTERKKAPAGPKIAKGATSFSLPSTGLLRMAERSERIQEDELKERARSIEQKCKEFDVGGHVTQINPGPVVTTYEFKPEAGIKYSRITGLAEDLVPGAAGRVHSDRAHSRKIDHRNRSAEPPPADDLPARGDRVG